MDSLPTEIWFLILGKTEFSARAVCSSWLEIIHQHPNFLEMVDRLERLRDYPDDISEIMEINNKIPYEVKCYIKGESDPDTIEIEIDHYNLCVRFLGSSDYLILSYHKDVLYLDYKDEGNRLLKYEGYFEYVLEKKRDLDFKLSYLLKQSHFPGAKSILLCRRRKLRIAYPGNISIYVHFEAFGIKEDEPLMEFKSVGKLIKDMKWCEK